MRVHIWTVWSCPEEVQKLIGNTDDAGWVIKADLCDVDEARDFILDVFPDRPNKHEFEVEGSVYFVIRH